MELEVMTMMPFIDPQHTHTSQRQLSVVAAEEYRLKRVLADAKKRRREQRMATRKSAERRYLGLLPRRTSATTR